MSLDTSGGPRGCWPARVGHDGGTCWWKTSRICGTAPLVELGEAGSGTRGRARDAEGVADATWGVSDSGRAGCAGLTTPTRSLGRDTAYPCWGSDSIAASRSSANCLTVQGWVGQQWSPGIAETGHAITSELPLVPKGAESGSGPAGESRRLGNRRFLRVLMTTSRLQRLVRGISLGRPGGATALLRVCLDSRTG